MSSNILLWDNSAPITEQVNFIHRLIKRYRLSLINEIATQDDIQKLLEKAQVPFVREFNFGKAGVIDFLINDTIGIEVKIKGQKMAIYRQCKRYCETKRIQHLILASLSAVNLPETIEDTPTSVLLLSQAFLS